MAGTLFSKAMIEFGLNSQGALQQLNQFQNKFSGGIGSMKAALAGFMGYKGLQGAHESVKQLVDVADKWRVPTEKLSQMRNLFITMGGSAEEAIGIFDKFKEMSNQLRLHSSGPLKDLSAVLRENLQKKDPEALIEAFRSQWNLLGNDDQEEVLRMLGADSVGIRNILRANAAEYAAAQYSAAQMPVVTAEDAKAAREITKASNEISNNTTKILSWLNNFATTHILNAVSGATKAVASPKNATIDDTLGLAGTISTAGAATAISGALAKGVGAGVAKATGITAAGKLGASAGSAGIATGGTLATIGAGLGLGFLFTHWANLLSDDEEARADRLNRLQSGKYSNLEQYWQDLSRTMHDVKAGNGIWTGNTAISTAELIKSEELLGKRVADFAAAAYMADPASYNRNAKNNELFREMLNKYGNNFTQTINIYGPADPEATRRAARDGVTQALGSVAMQNISPIQGY